MLVAIQLLFASLPPSSLSFSPTPSRITRPHSLTHARELFSFKKIPETVAKQPTCNSPSLHQPAQLKKIALCLFDGGKTVPCLVKSLKRYPLVSTTIFSGCSTHVGAILSSEAYRRFGSNQGHLMTSTRMRKIHFPAPPPPHRPTLPRSLLPIWIQKIRACDPHRSRPCHRGPTFSFLLPVRARFRTWPPRQKLSLTSYVAGYGSWEKYMKNY